MSFLTRSHLEKEVVAMKRRFLIAAILPALLILFPVMSMAEIPERPSPQRLVNDLAGLFTPSQVSSLERTLVDFDDSTSNQILVLTTADLEGYSSSEYAVQVGLKWGVGSADFDNGIVVLVKPKTPASGGQVSIQVGYGLEGAILDAYCKRIIENEMIPRFKDSDYFGGVNAAVQDLMGLASGEISEPREGKNPENGLLIKMLFGIFLMLIVIAVIFGGTSGRGGRGSRRRSRFDDAGSPLIFFGPVGGRGSFGDGGGFGGGDFGGFGGFGGGSFGGGGASGSW